MSKGRICNDCKYNNNGWCRSRKTNKGLKDLLECDLKKSNKIDEEKEENLKKLMEHTQNEENKFWERYFDDKSITNDLLDDSMKIMNLQKGIIQNLLAKVKILSSQ
ncbi:hypothetical protein UT300003_33060 [Clostridium sardiniense]